MYLVSYMYLRYLYLVSSIFKKISHSILYLDTCTNHHKCILCLDSSFEVSLLPIPACIIYSAGLAHRGFAQKTEYNRTANIILGQHADSYMLCVQASTYYYYFSPLLYTDIYYMLVVNFSNYIPTALLQQFIVIRMYSQISIYTQRT